MFVTINIWIWIWDAYHWNWTENTNSFPCVQSQSHSYNTPEQWSVKMHHSHTIQPWWVNHYPFLLPFLLSPDAWPRRMRDALLRIVSVPGQPRPALVQHQWAHRHLGGYHFQLPSLWWVSGTPFVSFGFSGTPLVCFWGLLHSEIWNSDINWF